MKIRLILIAVLGGVLVKIALALTGWSHLIFMAVSELFSPARVIFGIIVASINSLPSLIAVAVIMAVGARREASETRCRKCGYILRGLVEPRCSECGERI